MHYGQVLLFKIPRDIWLSIKDFLTLADIKNILDTRSILWKQIFKDTSWLDFAFNCAYCPRKLLTCLYLALIAYNYSGDLRYKCKSITLNVYNIINSYKTVKLPLEKIFTNTRKGDPDYRTYLCVSPGGWNGPACKGRDIKNGCRLILLDQGIKRTYVILLRCLKSKIWANIA
ncbi:hypothetical protein BJX63DRAFT_441529 [Aspergillus granulosus]|uniref:F-box domain-containing protein n=1 Tax=Aspergillus granulosus TaxID=176169 RepID=A0ABR4GSF2_9EURO